MKILTWNINGIRSVKKDQSLQKLFDSLDCDIICLQETKITREMLEEEVAIVEGYNAYFSFSKVRSGYSGVATFCRNHVTPFQAEDRIQLSSSDNDNTTEENCFTNELESLNAEGRTVLTEHRDSDGNIIVIINLYCPRADLDNKERTEFKLKFYSLVEMKCRSLIQQNKHVIVLGDFNVSHRLIDHCDPDDPEIFDSNPSRQWANTFIWDPYNDKPISNEQPETTKFIDSFRYFHPNQESAFTCWSTLTGARQTNYGTRIDYIFSSVDFFKREFQDSVIRPDIEGSDHCPVVATLKSNFQSAGKPPALCTKYMPEFSGKQQKLKHFFKKSEARTSVCNLNEKGELKKDEKLVTANESQNKKDDVSTGKMQSKRSAESALKSQAKRLKTNTGSSQTQGKIMNFFEMKSGKPKAENNGQVLSVEEKSQTFDKQTNELCSSIESTNSLSQNSTSSTSSTSDDTSSLSSSQNDTQSLQSKQKASSQNVPNKQSSGDDSAAIAWKNILKGPPPAPLCSGHKEPCVLRTVKNKGPNHGKKFYCCARPQGHSTNKEARCNHFTWVKK